MQTCGTCNRHQGFMSMKILPVIMCGGSGTRVWPESRESLPKQFIPLVGEKSTFQMAMDVLADDAFEMPVIISNHAYRFLAGEQLQKIGRHAHIVLEPEGRDSGPAVAVATEFALRSGPDTIVAVLAADHVVQNKAGFVALCIEAAKAALDGPYRHPGHQAQPCRDRLWLHQARRAGARRQGCVQGRAIRREAGQGDSRALHHRKLPVEFRQLLLPCRRHGGRTPHLRARDDRRGGGRPGALADRSRFHVARCRQFPARHQEVDRLCRSWSARPRPRSCPPTSAGRMSAIGRPCGNCPTAMQTAIPSAATARF